MSFPIFLVLLVLILAVAFFLFTRVFGLLKLFIGLAVFCVAFGFLVSMRDQIPFVFPDPVEEVLSLVENAALHGVSVVANILHFLAGLFGLS